MSAALPREGAAAPAEIRDLGTLLVHPLVAGVEPLARRANSPLRLDADTAFWLIESGRMELFAVEDEAGEAGARTHLGSAVAGQLLCGLAAAAHRDGAASGPSVGVLAVAAPAARLRRLENVVLRRLGTDAALREPVGELLDGWLGTLAGAVAPGPGPRAFTELQRPDSLSGPDEPAVTETPTTPEAPNTEIELAGGRAARPRDGVVWVRPLGGTCQLFGRAEMALGAGELAPVAEDSWLIAVDEARLTCTTSARLLAGGEVWPALDRFHHQILAALAQRARAGAEEERGRLARKTALDRQLMRTAYSRLAAVLRPRAPGGAAFEEVAAEPLLAACRLVAAAQGMSFRGHPEGDSRSRRGEHLASLCAASRVRYRRVILRGTWWRRDNGPLVGFLQPQAGQPAGAAGRPIALVPTSRSSYEVVDPAGPRLPVTEALAETLAGEAFMLYKPLPERPVAAADLLRAALFGRRRDLLTLVLMGLASGVLAMLVPIVSGQIFGHVIPDADRPGLLQLTVVLVVSALAASAFQLTRAFAVLRLSAKFEGTVQAAVWDRLLSLPVTFFRSYTVGDLADRSLGIERIRELFTGNVTTSILSAVFSVFSFALLFYYSWPLALLATALVAVLITVTAILTWLQLRHQRELLRLQGKIASLLLGLIYGISKLRVAGAEERAFSRWAEHFAEQRRRSVWARRIANGQSAFNATYAILTSLAIFAMISWSSGAGLPVGEFLAFNAAFGQFLAAALSSVSLLSSVLTLVPLFERLSPILVTPPEVDAEKADAGELAGEVEFSHVSFRYDEKGPLVLDDVSFRASPGEFIALVGPSGSGKSTCLRMVLGFEKPAAGSIYFDGQDLAALGIQSVRRQMGVVMQHSRLMAGDIFSNIIGGANLGLDDAWEAARMAGLEDDVRAMPMGMHTVVSEGAGTFSGGQRQRLLIARAIVNRPRIVLFDEATSALDNRTQEVVSRSLERLKATRVVIAHRLSTIVNADRIYVIDAGRVVEAGTHRELLARGGVFAELARRQIA